jgi:serine/threonine-protein kinase RsbW
MSMSSDTSADGNSVNGGQMTADRDDAAPSDEVPRDPHVQLVIPATARYLRLARLTAAGLAGDLGYPVDAIEDLRIAVDELCAAIIEGTPPGAELELTYHEQNGGLVVEGKCRARSANAPEVHSVARELLNMLADEYSIGAVDGHRNFRLVKHAEASSV